MTDVLNKELIEELKAIMEDDFGELLAEFLRESERQYLQAETAWDAGDYDILRRAAHSLKGSCANIGAQVLQETCATLEQSAKERELGEVPELLQHARSQLTEVCDALRVI